MPINHENNFCVFLKGYKFLKFNTDLWESPKKMFGRYIDHLFQSNYFSFFAISEYISYYILHSDMSGKDP